MAYLPVERAEPGTEFEIDVRGRTRGPRSSSQAALPQGDLKRGRRELPGRPPLPRRARLGPDRGRHRHVRDHLVRAGRARARSCSSTRRRSGTTVSKDEPYAEVESVKAVSDVIAPLSGEIVEVNEAPRGRPEAINDDPYGAGWMVKVRLSRPVRARVAAGRRTYRALSKLSVVSRYTSATDADRAAMLEAIGVGSVDELFADIPAALRLGRALDLPAGRSEQEVYAHLRDARRPQRVRRGRDQLPRARACTTTTCRRWSTRCISRSEFLTPYTPYQPEVSQGGLQVMFEYQTAISELTGLPVSNARVYEGPSAVAAAGYLARCTTGAPRFVVSRGPAPALARDAARPPPPAGASRSSRSRWPAAPPTPTRWPRRSTTTPAPCSSSSRTSSAPSRTSRRSPPAAKAAGALVVVRVRPDRARASCGRRARPASTSPSARASRSATGSTSAGRRSASSPRARSTCAACPAASRARRPTWTAGAGSSSRSRRASSTSAARRRRRTSARRRRSTRWRAWSTWPGWAAAASSSWASCCVQRTAYAREALAARRGRRACSTSSRSCASSP